MTKFGDVINVEIPVLIEFYSKWNDERDQTLSAVLKDVVRVMGDKAKVMKIDIQKNEILTNALKVKDNPTFLIYKQGVLKWKSSGHQNANKLIAEIQEYI